MSRRVRIGSGQGFWGDWLDAPIRQVEQGPLDYLMMDYLAEVTMSILQKQKSRDPSLGYAKDFVPLMRTLLPLVHKRNVRVVSNAGGVNPASCAARVIEAAREAGLGGKIKVGVVTGDDLLERLEPLLEAGHQLANMDTGDPLREILPEVRSANAYLGARPIVEALAGGADVVVSGRVTDTGLTLGPLVHAFGWDMTDWDRLAAGTVAGHIIECGAQCTGGNCMLDWEQIPGMEAPGYPVIEAAPDATFVVTKHSGTGGRVTVPDVTEQLVYEMGNPKEYITPDCIADFTTIRLEQAGKNRVAVTGVRGRPATDSLKVSVAYFYGFKAIGTLVYAWPDALAKARAANRILRERLERLGLEFEQVLTEYVGVDATHGALAGEPDPNLAEVQLRVGVRARQREPIERFTREIAPLVLNGPPSVTGFAGGRPKVEEIVAYWPALIDKSEIEPRVEILEA